MRSPWREDGHALDHVAELAGVAGPGVAFEQGAGFVVHGARAEVVAGAEIFEEVECQGADVLRALAQGGNAHRDDGDAVVEIFAELALGDHGLEVAVGGGDDAHGDADGLLAADAVEFAFLQNAQEFGLGAGMEVAHFIEEEGAAVGQFELAAAQGSGSGEGAFFVAEELAFDELGGDGGAVDLDERAGREGAELVEVRGEQFFAGAGFADEQHAGVGAGRHGGLFHRAQEGGAGADHLGSGADDLAQFFVLLPQRGLRERVFEGHQHAVAAERLFEEVESAGAGGFDGVGDGGVAGDHDDRRFHFLLLQPAQQVDAAAIGEAHVEEEDVHALGIGEGFEFGGGFENVDGEAFALEDHAQGAADVFFVVNDENAFGDHFVPTGGRRGSPRRPIPRRRGGCRRRG